MKYFKNRNIFLTMNKVKIKFFLSFKILKRKQKKFSFLEGIRNLDSTKNIFSILFISKSFRTILFVFIVFFTKFRPLCPPAFLRCPLFIWA